jgi:hypothetical protein
MFSWNSVFSPVSLSVSILAIKFMKIWNILSVDSYPTILFVICITWRNRSYYRHTQSLSLLIVWSWELLERPPAVQPLGSFPAFYGTQRFITAFTRALHLYLSWARPIQSTSPSILYSGPETPTYTSFSLRLLLD